MSDDYECGDIVLCNGLLGNDEAGYAVVVTNNKSLGSVMVYQFISINDHNHSNVPANTGAFINMLRLIRDNKNFNIFKDPDKAMFIDVESFFEIDNIELKSYGASCNSGMITKLSTVTRNNILIPNGLVIIHNNLTRHEVVGCKNNETVTMTPYDGSVYEHKTKDIFIEFNRDIIVDLINKLWPLAATRERSVISKTALRNSLRVRREE